MTTAPEESGERFVVGVDLSMCSTGLVACELGTGKVWPFLVRSSGKKTDSLATQITRHRKLVDNIATSVMRCEPVLVVVESLMFNTGPSDSSLARRGGLWWATVAELTARGAQVAAVTPSQLKLFATGKGNGKKEGVLVAAGRTWEYLDITTDDIADAAWLAAMGSYHLGGELPFQQSSYRDRAVSKVEWPDLGED